MCAGLGEEEIEAAAAAAKATKPLDASNSVSAGILVPNWKIKVRLVHGCHIKYLIHAWSIKAPFSSRNKNFWVSHRTLDQMSEVFYGYERKN